MYASVAYVFKSVGANKTPKEKREPSFVEETG